MLVKTKGAPYTFGMQEVKTVDMPETSAALSGLGRSPRDFSLAHLSDLHLTSLANVRLSQLLNKRLLGYSSWRRKRRLVHRTDILDALLVDLHANSPDHIAVTGDLTHIGLPQEFAEAGQWLARLGPPDQVTVIPGNHEAYTGNDWFRSCALWAPYLASTAPEKPSTASDCFPSLRIFGEVALIGLCSASPSLPFMATGTLGAWQLARLAALLEKTGKQGLLRVILVHHPPLPGTTQWRKRLTDSGGFTDVLKSCGAELVLHGHTHTPTFSELQTPSGILPIIGAPSASEWNPRSGRCAGYHIYRIRRIAAGWEVTLSVRGYVKALGRFDHEPETTWSIPSTS